MPQLVLFVNLLTPWLEPFAICVRVWCKDATYVLIHQPVQLV